MSSSRWIFGLLVLFAFVLPALGGGRQTDETNQAASAEIALTFDDLPAHGPLPRGLTRMDIARSIIHALQAAQAPPIYGFVNAKRIDEDPASAQVLQLWRDAGFPLGNHTFSHMDLQTNSVAAFEQNILADEAMLETYMENQDWRWLRFPFLHEGETPEKHRAIEAFLKQHGYKVAEVTMSFADYDYNEPYARCLAKNDTRAIEGLKKSYLDGAAEALSLGQMQAKQVFGRDIKHVMLLHIGGFETVMLPHLLELLKQRGFRLITLEGAESDPAYANDPDLPAKWEGTFLQRMMTARHIPQLLPSDNPLAGLDAVCR